MTTEQNRQRLLARRAAVHAALGDGHRLAIVDQLGIGDLSPGELGRSLGLSSNLLAHHLRTLEATGVVVRSRSEGDARRSYVRLIVEDPVVASLVGTPSAPPGIDRILFVCTHNTARSQLAAASWARRIDVPAVAAGTEPAQTVHPRAVRVATRHGLDLRSARTRHVDDVRRPGDLVVAVCDTAYESLGKQPSRPVHWSIADPARADTAAAFERSYRTIEARVSTLIGAFTPPIP